MPSNGKLPFLATEQPLRVSQHDASHLLDIGVRTAIQQRMAKEVSERYLTDTYIVVSSYPLYFGSY